MHSHIASGLTASLFRHGNPHHIWSSRIPRDARFIAVQRPAQRFLAAAYDQPNTAATRGAPEPPGGRWQALQRRLTTLGLAAVLSYGLIDGVSKTVMFTIAFLGYEASTGLNPAKNLGDLLKVYLLMWAGSNITRPVRVAGAAALAPFMDKVLDGLKERLGLPSKFVSFLLVVAATAGACLSVVGALLASRWAAG